MTKQEQNEVQHYEIHSGVFYRLNEGRLLLVIPKTMRMGIVIEVHDHGGHFSVDLTIARITSDYYWFSEMRRYVRH